MNLIKLTLATLIFVMSFAMQSNEAEAQPIDCPTGWQYHEFIAIDANGCSYLIKFCYQCNQFGPSPSGHLKYHDAEPLDDGCSNADFNWAFDLVLQQYIALCAIPPCNEGYLQMTVDIPMCRKWIHRAYENPPGNWNIMDFKQTCFDSEYLCVTTFDICYDALLGEYFVDEASIIHTESGTLDCLEEMPIISGPILENWESECWLDYPCPPIFDLLINR